VGGGKIRPTAGKTMTPGRGQLTILVDDHRGRDDLEAEHGFSLWLETGGKHILFDTGQGSALERNARALGIDLFETDAVVLSHGHYDHTGGLSAALTLAPKAEVFCHPGIYQTRYAVRDGKLKPVHMPEASAEALGRIPGGRIHLVLAPMFLPARAGVTGPIPRETAYEDAGGPFYLDREGRSPDPIVDDQALWLWTDTGLVVCVGCAHAGLVNTLNRIRFLNDGLRIRAVIGGFHLLQAGRDRLVRTMAALESFGLEALVPCHCTGDSAITFLKGAFPGRIFPGMVGTVFQF